MKRMRKFLVIAISFTLFSCALNMEKMKETFSEHLQSTAGRSYAELKNSPTRAFIGKREPESVSEISKNQVLHVYDYWKGTNAVRDGGCKVYLYFEKNSMVVTDAKSEGPGCYTAY